ncbi:MAG: DUF763 domain-containing protein [Candidatus Aenigmarchaeota archaeon]|nr:DUF763 domain-containing protein [Candidatus Aenigmarchaeota archaeon]
MRRTGTANLPLHSGHCPPWLFSKMKQLARPVAEAVVNEYSEEEFLRRLADPYWFQAFGCVLGFDWHSSGVTTTVCGALKECGLEEIGIGVAGGKGKKSLQAPEQIIELSDRLGFSNSASLVRASKLSAKVDNACVQDGYSLYQHSFFFSKDDWTVVQQGMNDENKYARRYHWSSRIARSFVDEPHAAICCDARSAHALDMTAKQSTVARFASVDALNEGDYAKLKRKEEMKTLSMPEHHHIELSKQVVKALNQAREINPANYEELIAIRGLGPAAVRALALTANLVYGTELSWQDPAKFSFSHGGKDGIPMPVDKKTYDNTISMLKSAVEEAKLGNVDKTRALRRLNEFVQ